MIETIDTLPAGFHPEFFCPDTGTLTEASPADPVQDSILQKIYIFFFCSFTHILSVKK